MFIEEKKMKKKKKEKKKKKKKRKRGVSQCHDMSKQTQKHLHSLIIHLHR